MRERWLNPPEWTRVEVLEFPASVDGPWARYVECGDLSPLSHAGDLSPAAAGRVPPQQSADKSAHSKIGLARYPRLVPKDAECAAKLKKRTLTNLYNERPAWLDLAHKKLDAAVAAAYGWVRAARAHEQDVVPSGGRLGFGTKFRGTRYRGVGAGVPPNCAASGIGG